jgi:hypothetical protein
MLHGARIAAVEWFERLLPATGDCRPGAGDSRSIRLEAHGSRHAAWTRAAYGT